MLGEFKITKVHDQNGREAQEDSYWAGKFKIDNVPVAVVCVCDGMGGLDNGKLASSTMCKVVERHYKQNGDWAGLTHVLVQASSQLYTMGKNTNRMCGTTCTILICCQGSYKLFHIGDTRCYHYTAKTGRSVILTKDHTMINQKKDILYELEHADPATDPRAQEKWERARMAKERWRNKLTRCLCTVENPKFDEYTGTYAEGDKFLLCSDGFWHYLNGDHFTSGAVNDLDALVEEFIGKGERDNMTAVLLTC